MTTPVRGDAHTRLLIGAELTEGQGPSEPILDPVTGQVIASVAEASPEQLDAAVAAAEAAFESWSQTSPAQRSAVLLQIAAHIDGEAEAYAQLESLNTGKPLAAMRRDEMPAIADVFRFFAGAARVQTGPLAGEYEPGHTRQMRSCSARCSVRW